MHIVLGCGGDRDTTKRGPMGAAAARLADTAVLTSDNPRSEDPLAILSAMLSGAAEVPVHERGDVLVDADRAAAIAAAVARAEPATPSWWRARATSRARTSTAWSGPSTTARSCTQPSSGPWRTPAPTVPLTTRTTVRDDQVITLSLAEIAEIVGGQSHDIPDPAVTVTGPVVIDSREVAPGSLFAAFAGERVDGHDYARRAVEAGAAAVLAARPVGVPAIVVDDVVGALGALARAAVERLGTTVVALTGSAGKTSTKDLIAQLLQRKGPTVWTPGSLNNEIGLPLTALTATPETEHLVLEMGARGIGHIRYLTS